jgi:hypothetical protein
LDGGIPAKTSRNAFLDDKLSIRIEVSNRRRYFEGVTAFLRFLGVLNAAVWFGASVFLFIGLPAVFSDDLKKALGPIGPVGVGWAAELIIARYFILSYCCGAVGLVHLALEWLYCGKPLLQRNLALLLALTGLALLGGLWLQPKLRELHYTMYFGATKTAQNQASDLFKAWHGASECGNLIVSAGLLLYLWRNSRAGETVRYGSLNLDKIRG